MAVSAQSRDGATQGQLVNFEFLKPTQAQWDVMLAVVRREPFAGIASEFGLTEKAVAAIAARFGVIGNQSKFPVVRLRDGYALLCVAGVEAKIDRANADIAAAHRWHLDHDGYLASTKLGKLHRWVAAAKRGEIVDHINGNKLDCRSSNLRIVSVHESLCNRRSFNQSSSIYKGVSKHPSGKWRAIISSHGKAQSLGYFSDQVEAAKAYDQAARKAHGDFARLNFPKIGEQSALTSEDFQSVRASVFDTERGVA